MNRSEFLRCMAAVFCGTLLPEPVREAIWLPRHSGDLIVSAEIPISQAVYDRIKSDGNLFNEIADRTFARLWDEWLRKESATYALAMGK